MKKINFYTLCLALFIFSLSGCADKFTLDVWKLPESGKTLEGIDTIVIQKAPPNTLNSTFDDALREALSDHSQYKVIPKISEEETLKKLEYFNYNLKDIDRKKSTAYISFQISGDYRHQLIHDKSRRTLRSCDYLRKKNKCWTSGHATLNNGKRKVQFSYNVTVKIKDAAGKELIAPKTISKSYTYNGKFAPDELILQSMFSKSVAFDVIKGISPYKVKEEIEFIGGDSLAETMIRNRAYRLAIDRIQNLGSDKTDAENLYMTGLCFEALEDFSGAYSFYNQAAQKLPDNEVIKKSLKRMSWSQKAKTM